MKRFPRPFDTAQGTRLRSSGFTLIELLLAVTIIGLLAGLVLPVSLRAVRVSDLEIARTGVTQAVRMAAARATAMEGDSPWGVRLEPGQVILYKGASYAVRDPSADEVTLLGSNITPSGLVEVTFAKLTGLPSTTGTFILTSPDGAVTVTINAQGIVSS